VPLVARPGKGLKALKALSLSTTPCLSALVGGQRPGIPRAGLRALVTPGQVFLPFSRGKQGGKGRKPAQSLSNYLSKKAS